MSISKIFILGLLFVSIFVFIMQFVIAGDMMTVEANILKTESNVSIVSIQVPDYISFGDIMRGEKSEELKVYVNNTGTVDLSVTPMLVNSSEKIFNYTYFRSTKTKNGLPVPFARIGDFVFNVTQENDAYFYMILDLTYYPEEINEDIIEHQTDIRFLAMSV